MTSAINHLPKEVLHLVFSWLARIDEPEPIDRTVSLPVEDTVLPPAKKPTRTIFSDATHLGWITATHVCRRWRNLILKMPLLWAGIAGGVLPSYQICEAIIKRARDHPLHFWHWHTFKIHRLRLARVVTQLLPLHRDRLESLALPIMDSLDTVALTGHTLTRLKNLYLEGMGNMPYNADHAAVDAPNLRTLHMNAIFLPFSASSLRSLRIDFRRKVNVPLASVLDFLPFTLLLEDLELRDPYEDEDRTPALHYPARLSHLTSLTLSGTAEQFVPIWKSIVAPSAVNVSLRVTGEESELEILSCLHALLSQPNKDSLRFSFDEDSGTFIMHLYASFDGPEYVTNDGKHRSTGVHLSATDIREDYKTEICKPYDLTTALIAKLVPENIRWLDCNLILDYFNDSTLCEPYYVRDLLRLLKNVSTVSVGRESDMKVLHELLCAEYTDTPFPRLRSVILKHPRDTIPNTNGTYSAVKHMLESWAYLGLICSTFLARHTPLLRVQVAACSVEELGGNEDAWRAQERWIRGARAWVDEMVVTDLTVQDAHS
ncbi:hypothetical protein PENSPDRAFT_32335 [Peniophora sp. CONT]|nr:hypothetical protein PENSPDRAFT_32335 [Peniophora sp. CONT]